MPKGIMIGPYARQIVVGLSSTPGAIGYDIGGRLKFWFALSQGGGQIKRYEALMGKGFPTFTMRHRPYFGSRAPKYGANFHDYRLPEDLTPFPSIALNKGDTLATTALALLRDEDIADVVRMRLIGALPTRQIWHLTENETCTSNQPLLI